MSVQRTEVDGVPAFWVPGDGPLRASLVFRVGQADEPVVRRGWTHLVEHLVLHGRDTVRRPVNGSVAMLHTSLDVMGDPDEVAELLSQVAGWLGAPRFDDLAHEARVLRAEDAQRGSGPLPEHLMWRYGPRGPGVVDYEELGLRAVTPDDLLSWTARAFARGNAALAMSGPPPAGLRLALPEGDRVTTPRALPCEQSLPGCFVSQHPGITVSGTAARTSAATAFTHVMQRALQADLRGKAAATYGVRASYDVVDATTAVLSWTGDVLPDRLPHVMERAYEVLTSLLRGPDAAELRDQVAVTVREMSKPEDLPWQAWASARSFLLDGTTATVEALTQETQALTVEDVADVAESVRRSLLMSTRADGVPQSPPVPLLAADPGPLLAGTRYRAVDAPYDTSELTVGPAVVEMATSRQRIAVPVDRVAFVTARPDGARTVVRDDGYCVVVEPTLFRDGRRAVEQIDDVVPASLVVRLDPREPGQVPKPAITGAERARRWAQRHLSAWAVALLCLTLLVMGVIGLAHGHSGLLLVGLASAGVAAVRAARQRSTQRTTQHTDQRRDGAERERSAV